MYMGVIMGCQFKCTCTHSNMIMMIMIMNVDVAWVKHEGAQTDGEY